MTYQPRYQWRLTGLGRKQDFAAHDGERAIGRIYLIEGGPQGKRWYWSMHAHGVGIDRMGRTLSGHADTPREAARMVEEAWEAVRPGAARV